MKRFAAAASTALSAIGEFIFAGVKAREASTISKTRLKRYVERQRRLSLTVTISPTDKAARRRRAERWTRNNARSGRRMPAHIREKLA